MCHQMPFWCGIRCKTIWENYGCGCVWAVLDNKRECSKDPAIQRTLRQRAPNPWPNSHSPVWVGRNDSEVRVAKGRTDKTGPCMKQKKQIFVQGPLWRGDLIPKFEMAIFQRETVHYHHWKKSSWKTLLQKSREGGVREGGVAQICRKLRAKFVQIAWYFVSYITRRVRKIVANLSQIRKSISDNFMQIPLSQCPLLQISDCWPPEEPSERVADTKTL